MSWLRCPVCRVKRSVEQTALPEGWKNAPCWNCKDPGWIQPYDSDDPLSGRISGRREEARCTEQTVNAILDNVSKRPAYSTPFEVAVGIPIVVSEDVPEGRVQIWQEGKMVKEIVL